MEELHQWMLTTYEGAKENATQDPKDMDPSKATKAKETTANQKKRKQQLHNMPSMWQAWPLGTRLQAHRRRRRTQIMTTMKNYLRM